MTSGRLFILILLIFGVLAGLVALNAPAVQALPIPSIAWPLVVALLLDLALMPLVRNGKVAPITMNERFIGVLGSALIITAILSLAPAQPGPT
jgi:hypothetical protein